MNQNTKLVNWFDYVAMGCDGECGDSTPGMAEWERLEILL